MVEIIELDSPEGNQSDFSRVESLINDSELAKLAALVEDGSLSLQDQHLLLLKVKEWLHFTPKPWDWLRGNRCVADLEQKLQLAVALFASGPANSRFDLMALISCYMNPNVPWSSGAAAAKASKIALDLCIPHMDEFVTQLRLDVLESTSTKVSGAGYARPKTKSALRPTLGLSGGSAGEEAVRAAWKQSARVKSLSSVWLLVVVGLQWLEFNHHWPLATTFILNVMDDSDPLFRAQSCHLLGLLMQKHPEILLKSGLDKLFKDSVDTCLTYLPKLTPAPVSLHVLKAAYPVLFQLLELQRSPYTRYLDVLEKNVLGLISHVLGRDNDAETILVLQFLVDQLRYVITNHIKSSVLAVFSRTNFVVYQIIINPYVIEAEMGPQLVDSALLVHSAILDIFSALQEKKPLELILLFKYDLLGAWTVLAKRIVKFEVGTSRTGELIEANVGKLKQIAEKCGSHESDEFNLDLQAIWTKAPLSKVYVH